MSPDRMLLPVQRPVIWISVSVVARKKDPYPARFKRTHLSTEAVAMLES